MGQSKFLGVLSFLIFCGITTLNAQQAIVPLGGDANGANGSLSYTFGQTFYQENHANKISILEGVQQAYEISIVAGISDHPFVDLQYKIYPNPTRGNIILSIDEKANMQAMQYQMFDFNGKLIKEELIHQRTSHIDMENLSSSVYFLKVFNDTQLIKSFKIIKN